MPYLSLISLANIKFRKSPQKHKNSTEMGKFGSSAQNFAFCRKLWSLVMIAIFKTSALKPFGMVVNVSERDTAQIIIQVRRVWACPVRKGGLET